MPENYSQGKISATNVRTKVVFYCTCLQYTVCLKFVIFIYTYSVAIISKKSSKTDPLFQLCMINFLRYTALTVPDFLGVFCTESSVTFLPIFFVTVLYIRVLKQYLFTDFIH
jgi:hypothetical protein